MTELLSHSSEPAAVAGTPPRARPTVLSADPAAARASQPEASLWRSPGGSLYLFDGDAFTCIAVHSSRFRGWLGRVALQRVTRAGALGSALQAFRAAHSGQLVAWGPVHLHFAPEVIVKEFPAGGTPGVLVYGPVETYVRIRPGAA